MKSLTMFLLLAICTSASFAGFDYTISNTYEYGVVLENVDSLSVTGGGADQIDAFDFSYIEVHDTAPLQMYSGGINVLHLNQNSALNYYGGETGGLKIYNNATAVLQGGQILGIESYQNITDGPHIEIICNDHEYTKNFDIGYYGENIDLLRVQWDVGGGWVDIQLVDQDPQWYAPAIDNIFFTPEPTSLAMLALGGLLLRRRSVRG